MRRVQLLLSGVLLASLSTLAQAAPTDYVIKDFTLEQGTVAPSGGSFTYDPLTGFSSFLVSWGGATFDLTNAANNPTIVTGGTAHSTGTHVDSFALLTQTLTGPADDFRWFAYTGNAPAGPETTLGFQSDPNDATFIRLLTFSSPVGPFTGVPQIGEWQTVPVPEADTMAMLAAGLVMVSTVLRRSNRSRRRA